MEWLMYATIFLAPTVMGVLIYVFFSRYKYKYIGNLLKYIIPSYIVCLLLSFAVNTNPLTVSSTMDVVVDDVTKTYEVITTNVSFDGNVFQALMNSFFDALKMMAMAFDKTVINPYFKLDGWHITFGILYYVFSVFALVFSSIGTILFFFKSFGAKFVNFRRSICKKKKVYYIFSESKCARPTIKLARGLVDKKHIVIIYVSKASLKTQEGTEYRDRLINEGFDVRSENVTKELCTYIFKKFFNRHFKKLLFLKWPYRNRDVTIYGIFDDDDSSMKLASFFRDAITGNKYWDYYKKTYLSQLKTDNPKERQFPDEARIAEDISNIRNIRIFVTYQSYDFDLNNNFSGNTLHIINTLSQYDMVSSEFVSKHQLIDYLPEDLSTIQPGALNISFFGLGNINRPIFEKLTYAFQSWADNEHAINYHIYDYKSKNIVNQLRNVYTEEAKPNSDYLPKPLLYRLFDECDGEDLTAYDVLDRHFSNITDPNRFNKNGFEIFIISVATTNQDTQIAIALRDVLIKRFGLDRLKNTYIYVRIGDETVAKNLKAANNYIFSDSCPEDKNAIKERIAPIVAFGENTNLADFIDTDYDRIIKLGRAAYGSYCGIEGNALRINWRLLNKFGILDNVPIAFSIKTKLALLGYDYMTDSGEIIDRKTNMVVSCKDFNDYFKALLEKTNYPDDDETNPIIKLAHLEHNRWLASSYLVHKYEQLELKRYEDSRERRDANNTRHVFMTTNAGLAKLYGIGKDYKRCFLNDIDATKASFEVLVGKPVEEENVETNKQDENKQEV